MSAQVCMHVYVYTQDSLMMSFYFQSNIAHLNKRTCNVHTFRAYVDKPFMHACIHVDIYIQ